MANRPIKELVNHIVDCEGKKGKAVASLQTLHTNLQADLEKASTDEDKTAIKHDIWFLEGYMEAPAACIADTISSQKLVDRTPRKRRRA